MTDAVMRPEFEARIEALETRMDAKIDRMEMTATQLSKNVAVAVQNMEKAEARFEKTEERFFAESRSTKKHIWASGLTVILGVGAIVYAALSQMNDNLDARKDAIDAQLQLERLKSEREVGDLKHSIDDSAKAILDALTESRR